MRPGLLEIVLIIVVLIVVVVIVRIIRAGRTITKQDNESSTNISERASKLQTNRLHGFFRRAGITLLLVGIILILIGISMFQWALQSYAWSFIAIAIGFILLFLSRNKG